MTHMDTGLMEQVLEFSDISSVSATCASRKDANYPLTNFVHRNLLTKEIFFRVLSSLFLHIACVKLFIFNVGFVPPPPVVPQFWIRSESIIGKINLATSTNRKMILLKFLKNWCRNRILKLWNPMNQHPYCISCGPCFSSVPSGGAAILDLGSTDIRNEFGDFCYLKSHSYIVLAECLNSDSTPSIPTTDTTISKLRTN